MPDTEALPADKPMQGVVNILILRHLCNGPIIALKKIKLKKTAALA